MRHFKGYRVIDIPLGVGGALQSLYIKEHIDRVNKADKDNASSSAKGKTLFVGNIDYGRHMKEKDLHDYLKFLFASFGNIVSISFSIIDNDNDIHTISRFAHILFDKKNAIKNIISASDTIFYNIGKELSQKWGPGTYFNIKRKKSIEEVSKMFSYIDTDPLELQEEVDSFMKEFDENEEMELAERLRQSKEPDDDGFIKVVNKSKRKRPENDLDENTSARKANTASRSRNKKKKPKELKNFYRFQIKEAKVKQLDDLRKKFEEDKVKVSKMKEDRKFKPF
jgi:ribosomal RNA-processing protein 7